MNRPFVFAAAAGLSTIVVSSACLAIDPRVGLAPVAAVGKLVAGAERPNARLFVIERLDG